MKSHIFYEKGYVYTDGGTFGTICALSVMVAMMVGIIIVFGVTVWSKEIKRHESTETRKLVKNTETPRVWATPSYEPETCVRTEYIRTSGSDDIKATPGVYSCTEDSKTSITVNESGEVTLTLSAGMLGWSSNAVLTFHGLGGFCEPHESSNTSTFNITYLDKMEIIQVNCSSGGLSYILFFNISNQKK